MILFFKLLSEKTTKQLNNLELHNQFNNYVFEGWGYT